VPDQRHLIIEARVAPDDVDDVRQGIAADVRLVATVTYVSADRLVDEATRPPYYTAYVEVDPESLKAESHASLQPGMPAEVFIRTRERSALDYLLEPITNSLRRAGRES
jgi:HlyD family secretion protein